MSRLPLSRQLLILQLAIVMLVVATVAGVSLVQTDQAFRRDEGRRMLGAAESLASEELVRRAAHAAALTGDERDEALGRLEAPLEIRLEGVRVSAGATYVFMLDADRRLRVGTLPRGSRSDRWIRSDVEEGASWSGESQRFGQLTMEAQVPLLSAKRGSVGEILGYVVIGRNYPSRLEVLGTAAPSVFFYLALAGAFGTAGSLLLARRIKRQTLGLEPQEIAALVEQREAMLHGVREGVLGVDLAGVVAFVNDEALDLLDLDDDVLGRPIAVLGVQEEVAAILKGQVRAHDVVVAIGPRLLVLNAQPVHVRERQTGWVTSMRDHTELLGLQHELAEAQAGTDTLRAQVHEFRNRLHAISGMAELGRPQQLTEFVEAVMSDLDARLDEVQHHIGDPAVAALVVAKKSRADELGVTFDLAEGAGLDHHGAQLSADLVTVVGNLVDNAFEAAGQGGSVVLDIADDGERVEIEVRDSGRGIADEHLDQVFEMGWTTKEGEDVRGHGFGLALTRMACRRHGGSVQVANRDGAVLYAELYVNGSTDA